MALGKRFVMVCTEDRSSYYHNSGKTSAVDPDKVTHIEDCRGGATIHFMGGGKLQTTEGVMKLAERLTAASLYVPTEPAGTPATMGTLGVKITSP